MMLEDSGFWPRFLLLSVFGIAIPLLMIACVSTDPVASDNNSSLSRLDVELAPDSLYITVTKSLSGNGTFEGNITVDGVGGINHPTVTLNGASNQGWEVIVTPHMLVYSVPSTQPFWATVVVPPQTPVMSSTLTVMARLEWDGGRAEDSATATVRVGQYHAISATTVNQMIRVEPGGTATGQLTVINEGNGDDIFRFEVIDANNALVDHDIPEMVSVSYRGSATVDFAFFTDEDYQPGNEGNPVIALVTIRVISVKAEERNITAMQEYTINLRFPTFEERVMDEVPTIIALCIAGTIFFVALRFIVLRARQRRDVEKR